MGEATWDNIWAIKCVLQLFEAAFGLKVNFNKSQLLGFNLEGDWLDRAARVLHCSIGSVPFKYLGLPIGANSGNKHT